MAASDPKTILVAVACDEVHDAIWAALAVDAAHGALHVVVPADAGGSELLQARRRLLDASLGLLVELECAATGTIGPKGADALAAADGALAEWAADEAVVLIDPADDLDGWERRVAQHALLRHGAPVRVRPGAARAAAA